MIVANTMMIVFQNHIVTIVAFAAVADPVAASCSLLREGAGNLSLRKVRGRVRTILSVQTDSSSLMGEES
jgi:hypothetical protein